MRLIDLVEGMNRPPQVLQGISVPGLNLVVGGHCHEAETATQDGNKAKSIKNNFTHATLTPYKVWQRTVAPGELSVKTR